MSGHVLGRVRREKSDGSVLSGLHLSFEARDVADVAVNVEGAEDVFD